MYIGIGTIVPVIVILLILKLHPQAGRRLLALSSLAGVIPTGRDPVASW
jgi:hypothetical protein